MLVFHVAVTTFLVAVVLQVILNLRVLPRLRPPAQGLAPAGGPTVSVLIPARNEGSRIAPCLHAWRGEITRSTELLVLDDESADDTRDRAQAGLAAGAEGRLLAGARRPAGWTGKSFACHQLAHAARGDILVFADVDVRPQPGTLDALRSVLARRAVDGVSVLPRHTAASRLGRHLAPLQAWAVACFCPLWLARRRQPAVLTVTNGQLFAIRRAAYEAVGGHRAVQQSLAEDTDLGRRLAAAGFRLQLVDGSEMVECATYDTLRETWLGNTRNLFAVLFHSPLLAGSSGLVLVLAWVVPWIALVASLGPGGGLLWASTLEVFLGLASRAIVARRFRHALAEVWSHPLLVLLLVAMIAGSVWAYRRGCLTWRGRVYAGRTSPAREDPAATVPSPRKTSPMATFGPLRRLYDGCYGWVHGLRNLPVGDRAYLRLSAARYRRRPIRLPDGTRLAPGQRVVWLHLHNETLAFMVRALVEPGRTGLAFRRALVESLEALAVLLETDPALVEVRAIGALTTFWQGSQRFGFGVFPVWPRWWARVVAAYQLSLTRQLGSPRAVWPPRRWAKGRAEARLIWISAEALRRRYGSVSALAGRAMRRRASPIVPAPPAPPGWSSTAELRARQSARGRRGSDA